MAILLGGRSVSPSALQDRTAIAVYREPAVFAGQDIQLVIISQHNRCRDYYLAVVDAANRMHLMHLDGEKPVVVYRALRILAAILQRGTPGMNLDSALVDRCLAAACANLDPSDALARQDIDWATAWIDSQCYYWFRSLTFLNLPEAIRVFRLDNRPSNRKRRPLGYARRH